MKARQQKYRTLKTCLQSCSSPSPVGQEQFLTQVSKSPKHSMSWHILIMMVVMMMVMVIIRINHNYEKDCDNDEDDPNDKEEESQRTTIPHNGLVGNLLLPGGCC